MLKRIFKAKSPIIGMVHFMPLLGYEDFPGLERVLEKALKDTEALGKGGVNGIIVENNYDIPHKIFVNPETIACMTLLTEKIIEQTNLPVGVSVLWNDYRASLSIAKLTGAKLVRVPVFVDKVRTAYGDILGEPKKVLAFRKKIGAAKIAIFADIQVKHAKMLEEKDLVVSAKQAIKAGADALIVTGRWTADAPDVADLKRVRDEVGQFPILVGSGATKENLSVLLQYADGVIVGTSLKSGKCLADDKEPNIKGFQETIKEKKVREFVKAAEKVINLERRR